VITVRALALRSTDHLTVTLTVINALIGKLNEMKKQQPNTDDFDCIHVGFALALPEVRMALKNMH
jgi:hypothetical protein